MIKSKQFEKEKKIGGIKRTGTIITERQFEKSTEITDELKMQASGTWDKKFKTAF